jgi:alcohol dehydrogenase (cytochrome c)
MAHWLRRILKEEEIMDVTRKFALALLAAILAPLAAHAQTAQDLIDSAQNTENVLTYGMGYGQQRYSTLSQIDTRDVRQLVPVWNYSLNDNRGEESQPLVIDGVMYVTTHNATMAIDALTGRQIWKTTIEYPAATPRVACCGIVNRGLAAYEGKLFRTTLDDHVVAYDMKTGKQLWKSKAIDFKTGYSMTVAPLVADGVVITGISGGEYGIRGFLDGWAGFVIAFGNFEGTFYRYAKRYEELQHWQPPPSKSLKRKP